MNRLQPRPAHRSRPHPLSWTVLATVLLLGLAACKGSDGSADSELADKTAGLTEDQESLLQRRDAVLNARRKLRERRKALAEQRQQVIASGGDTSELDQQAVELNQEEAQLGEREAELEEELGTLFNEQRQVLTSIVSKGDESAHLAAREGSMAGREKLLSEREARLAEREAALAERERKLAERERDTCGAAAVAPTIIQAPPPPGGTTYDKKDVEPLLQRARRHMEKKGILRSDLPATARDLEKEATQAMKKGDYAGAHFAARQLMSTVDATVIDRAFIQAKIGRLNEAIKGTTLPADKQKKVDSLFKEATRSYGDANYSRANKRLNEIYALL